MRASGSLVREEWPIVCQASRWIPRREGDARHVAATSCPRSAGGVKSPEEAASGAPAGLRVITAEIRFFTGAGRRRLPRWSGLQSV